MRTLFTQWGRYISVFLLPIYLLWSHSKTIRNFWEWFVFLNEIWPRPPTEKLEMLLCSVASPHLLMEKTETCNKKTIVTRCAWKYGWDGVFIFPHYRHCAKIVQIRSFSGPYFPVLGLNTDQKKLRIWTLFTQWGLCWPDKITHC